VAQQEFDPYELLDALRAGGDVDLIRQSVEAALHALIEAEATAVIRAGPHERTGERQNYRNGRRPRLLSTKAGDLELSIPMLRSGSSPPDPGAPAQDRPGACRGRDGGLGEGESLLRVDDPQNRGRHHCRALQHQQQDHQDNQNRREDSSDGEIIVKCSGVPAQIREFRPASDSRRVQQSVPGSVS
jgi:hypothetical protein